MRRYQFLSNLQIITFVFCFVIICFNGVSAQHIHAPTVWNESLSTSKPRDFSLFRRQTRTCSKTQKCSDGSCCNGQSGVCGLDKEHCDPSVCISNCDAKAECGSWGETPGELCPLNVCCGQFGYCGTTADFCGSGCQSNCKQPPANSLNNGDVTNLVIGYYEAWAPYRRGACPNRPPSWIRTDSITHLYVAFAYIAPKTYEIYPMNETSEEIFLEIMQLKQTAPGLKIFLSLGGWTYSDNETDTQPVWGELASTSANRQKFIGNLVNFMTNYGFDGVDIDWEYPGASDRGGKKVDTANYVLLMQDIRTFWTAQTNGWGLSFTAPTSYWYMRWFDIGNLTQYADWVNLMTYDLHGSWDSPEDQIGSYVYAHTNLTEISDALDLLWRNNVPANKVNLGLGFYGRSYTLSDPSCTLPGCEFSDTGVAGSCTGTGGILSYEEITAIADTYSIKPVEDKKAAAMYFAFDEDQWVSYDNVATIKEKVDYANKNGLLGLFIWALDLDNDNYDALAAVLDAKGGLGAFKAQNGVGPAGSTDWQPTQASCFMSECSTSSACPGTHRSVGHSVSCDGKDQFRWVCCPRDRAPDASTCEWKSSITSFLGLSLVDCNNGCLTDEVLIAESKWYYDDDSQSSKKCLSGYAQYCCATSEDARSLCGMLDGSCISIKDGKPDGDDPCAASGRVYATYSQDTCPDGSWRPWCCNEQVDVSQCAWQGPKQDIASDACIRAMSCPANLVNMGHSKNGGGYDCTEWSIATDHSISMPIGTHERALCCAAGDVVVYNQTAPVPLAWLFIEDVPDSDKQKYEMNVETEATGNQDPNENGFGWVIMTGPEDQLASLDKRDGSHWELFDCPDRETIAEDDRITVRAVCSDDSSDSNCDVIFRGGVERTVVEMPPACGIGRYAMAVSMESAEDQTVPKHVYHKLVKRGANLRARPHVYSFTFDYDFSVLHGRADNTVQIRIDYSEDPGYWAAIVDNDPKNTNPVRKREVAREVDRRHGGSWKRYAEHQFHSERMATPKHNRDEFEKRWWTLDPAIWLEVMDKLNEKGFEGEIPLASHHLQDTFPFWLFNERLQCSLLGIPYDAYFTVWADLHVDILTSAQLTLIGHLNDLTSWNQSHVLFRNKGSIQAGLHMEAQATVRFSTGSVELFGMQNFGGTFTVPGIVTIGPNFRVLGQLTGVFTAHTQAHYNMDVLSWDYSQRYPNPDNDVLSGLTDNTENPKDPGIDDDPDKPSNFTADVTVNGDITLQITPLVEFGVRFNPKYKATDTTISLQLNTHATLYGSAGVGTDTAASVCYGALAGAELFAQVQAPSILGVNPNRRWSFYKQDVDILEQKCYGLKDFFPSDCPDCD